MEKKEIFNEKLKKQTEEKYNLLFETSRDAVMTLEPPEWKFTSANNATIKMFMAKDEKDFISKGPWEVSPKYQPDKELSDIKAKKMIEKAMKKGSNFFEWTHKRLNGEEFPATVLLSRIKTLDKIYLQATVRDITKQKIAEEKIKDSELRLKAILNNSPAVIFVKDINGKYLFVNSLYEKLFHIKNEKIIGKTDFEVFPKEAAKSFRDADIKIIKANKAVEVEEMVPQDDGNHYYISLKFPLYDLDNNMHAVCGIATDITERKKYEKEIENNNKFLKTALDSLNHPFYVINANDYTIELANSATGITDLSKKPKCHEISHHLKEPCKGLNDRCPLEIIKKTKKPIILEHIHYDREGKQKNVEVYSYPIIDEKGSINRFIEFSVDITERKLVEEQLKESELKFKAIFENSIDGILIADLKTKKFLIGNNKISKMLGYNKEEIINLSVSGIHPKESLPYVGEQFEKQVRGEITISENLPVKRKDGSIFYADVGAVPLDLGEKKYLLGSFRDITERKKSEEQLKESEEKYRSIIENAEDQIFALDKDYKFISANPKVASLLKTTPDKLIGKSMLDFFPKEITTRFSKNIQEVFVTSKSKFTEEKMIIGNKVFYNSTVLNPIKDAKGKVLAVMGIVRDITKQKESEEKLKERTEELEKFNQFAVGRELKMISLKKEVNELCKKIGEKPKYEID